VKPSNIKVFKFTDAKEKNEVKEKKTFDLKVHQSKEKHV
jgi:hypothetical protein